MTQAKNNGYSPAQVFGQSLGFSNIHISSRIHIPRSFSNILHFGEDFSSNIRTISKIQVFPEVSKFSYFYLIFENPGNFRIFIFQIVSNIRHRSSSAQHASRSPDQCKRVKPSRAIVQYSTVQYSALQPSHAAVLWQILVLGENW